MTFEKDQDLLSFNLQLFAEGDGEGDKDKDKDPNKDKGDGKGGDGGDGKDGDSKKPKTFTEEELQALLQKESDRRVNDALKKFKEKSDADTAEKERLAKLTQDEREKELKVQQELALRDKEVALTRKGLALELIDVLKAQELDLEFKDLIPFEDLVGIEDEDARSAKLVKKVTQFKTAFDKVVETKVAKVKEDLLKGNYTPYNNDKAKDPNSTQEQEKEKAKKSGNVMGMLANKFKSRE